MPKTVRSAQDFFSSIFYLEKVTALEENGGALELWKRCAVCVGGRFRLKTAFLFASRR
jgi:hypothetical protein